QSLRPSVHNEMGVPAPQASRRRSPSTHLRKGRPETSRAACAARRKPSRSGKGLVAKRVAERREVIFALDVVLAGDVVEPEFTLHKSERHLTAALDGPGNAGLKVAHGRLIAKSYAVHCSLVGEIPDQGFTVSAHEEVPGGGRGSGAAQVPINEVGTESEFGSRPRHIAAGLILLDLRARRNRKVETQTGAFGGSGEGEFGAPHVALLITDRHGRRQIERLETRRRIGA